MDVKYRSKREIGNHLTGELPHITPKVVDNGSGLAIDQLDHYTGVSGCNICTAPGDDLMTIKLIGWY